MDNPANLISILDTVNKLQVDITCLQEVNDSLPRQNMRKIKKALGTSEHNSKLSISALRPYLHHIHAPTRRSTNSHGNTKTDKSVIKRRPKTHGKMGIHNTNFPKVKVDP